MFNWFKKKDIPTQETTPKSKSIMVKKTSSYTLSENDVKIALLNYILQWEDTDISLEDMKLVFKNGTVTEKVLFSHIVVEEK